MCVVNETIMHNEKKQKEEFYRVCQMEIEIHVIMPVDYRILEDYYKDYMEDII